MIRTALYYRVSTEEQHLHGLSLEAQDAALTEYANKNDLTIVGRYVDEGITARKKMTNRKALLRLLDDVKAGKIDLIIFTKIDRWFRNIYDYHKVQEILEKHNVNWRTIYESYDTSSAAGRLHINIMLSVAQDEADRTSERIKAVFENKVKKGEYLSAKVPIGYRVENSKIHKDEETSAVTEALFKKFFDTHSMYATQIYIAETYGVTFTTANFRKTLKNSLYCGEYRGIEICEPYITKEQHKEILAILENKHIKHNSADRVYLFSGLLICPECGGRLSGCSTRYQTSEGKKEARSYKCRGYERTKRCGFKTCVSESIIENYLIQHAVAELDKYESEQSVKATSKEVAKNTDKEIEKIKKKLSKLKDLYVNDMIDIEDYKKDYDQLKAKLDELQSGVEEKPAAQIDVEAIKSLLSKPAEELYQTLTADNRRKFWHGFVDHIVVHDRENMEIFFK